MVPGLPVVVVAVVVWTLTTPVASRASQRGPRQPGSPTDSASQAVAHPARYPVVRPLLANYHFADRSPHRHHRAGLLNIGDRLSANKKGGAPLEGERRIEWALLLRQFLPSLFRVVKEDRYTAS